MMTTLVDCRISHCDLDVVDFNMQHISLVFVVDIIYYNIIIFIVVVDKYVPGFLERHEQMIIYYYICVFLTHMTCIPMH